MSFGKIFPHSGIAANKQLLIAIGAVLILIFGLAIALNGCGGNEQNVSKKEAEQAKNKGLSFYRQGKWDQAAEELKKAVSGDPKDIQAQFQLAYVYEQKGQFDNAYKQYENILKTEKGSADAHYNMGRILMQKKDLDKAISELEAAAKLDSDFTSVRASLADAYVQKKEFGKALAVYSELENIIKSDNMYLSRIHSSKGMIYKQMGKLSEAKAEFAKSLELDKNNKDAISGLK